MSCEVPYEGGANLGPEVDSLEQTLTVMQQGADKEYAMEIAYERHRLGQVMLGHAVGPEAISRALAIVLESEREMRVIERSAGELDAALEELGSSNRT